MRLQFLDLCMSVQVLRTKCTVFVIGEQSNVVLSFGVMGETSFKHQKLLLKFQIFLITGEKLF